MMTLLKIVFLWKKTCAQISLLGISMTYLINFKNDDCACQKTLKIRTDGVTFQIILACFALAAILGHYAA